MVLAAPCYLKDKSLEHAASMRLTASVRPMHMFHLFLVT